MNTIHIKRALISVTDKSNLEQLARALHAKKVEIISTGGTAKKLKELNIPYTPIEKITGNPEVFDGRMKTISFEVGSSLLFRRDDSTHQAQAKELGIKPIDLVVCNLYQFEEASRQKAQNDELIEKIDIGGPCMIRAAAKNYKSVSILTHPAQYDEFISHLNAQDIDEQYNKQLALSAFELTFHYDQIIYETLSGTHKELRYGENPHQKAQWKKIKNTGNQSLFDAKIYQGKELSYNNILDLDSAWKSCYDALYSVQADSKNDSHNCASIIKHLNPAGLSVAKTKNKALELAWKGDPVSAFGSVMSFSFKVEKDQAQWLSDKFIEIIAAPSFSQEALEIFSKKKNLRVIEMAAKNKDSEEMSFRSVSGAMLIQEEDQQQDCEFQFVTKKKLSEQKISLAKFGSAVCKHLRSNAVCLVSQNHEDDFWLTGAGMGQPNRLDSLRQLAIPRFQGKENVKIEEAILVSDAFFPFRDSVDVANEYKIKSIVQPGGSIKDKEVIQACDEHGIAMAFTGKRHFRH